MKAQTESPVIMFRVQTDALVTLDPLAQFARSPQSGSRYAVGSAPCGGCGAVLIERGVRRVICDDCTREGVRS